MTIIITVLTLWEKIMLIDDFKIQYKTIPFATTFRYQKKNTLKNDLETLSHMHREMEILLVLEGEAGLCAGGNSYKIKKGDIVLIPPYILHNYTIFTDYDFKHNCLCFDLDLLYDKKLKKDLEKGRLKMPFVINNKKCFESGVEAYNINEKKQSGWEFQIIGNLSLFFGVLMQEGLITKVDNLSQKNICREIMELISVNYACNITSTDIAQELHMNNSYFCRLFKKHFGCPFQNYLSVYRIEKAKLYLKNTDLSVSEISFNTGFNSLSYFGKIFKEYTGFTPLEYRTNYID